MRFLIVPLLSLTALIMTTTSSDAFAAEHDSYAKHVYEHKGKKLNYRLYSPTSATADKKVPLVVFLHGAGERGNDNVAQLKHGAAQLASGLVQDEHPSYILAPQVPKNEKWVDVDWSGTTHDIPSEPSESLGLTLQLIEELIAEKPIDPSRIYITGLSMGGYGTWDLMARWPNRVAAAIPICGGADPKTAEKVKHIPVWVFHGDADRAVKPQRSRDMVAALKAAGGDPKYTEYEGVGHDSWSQTYRNPEVYKWLFSHSLDK